MPILIVETGPAAGTRFTFGPSAVVGRVPPADVVLDNPTVSRRHAMLRRADHDCSVVDLGSINGTFVDGRRIARPTRVREGTLLQFGAVRVRYVEDAAHASSAEAEAIETIADDPDRWYERQVTLPAGSSSIVAPLPSVAAPNATDMLTELADRLQVLDAVARFSCKVLDQPAILSFVAEQVFALLPNAERVLVLTRASHTDTLMPAVGRARDGSLGHTRMSRTLLNEILANLEGVLVTDVPAAAAGMSTSLDTMNIRSLLCVPVVFDGEVYGVIHADTTSFASRFDRRDLTLLLALAGQLGMALAYTRLHAEMLQRLSMEQDLEFARRLQRHFLPQQLPAIPGYEVAVHLGVADKLGGDLYDVLPVGNDTHAIVVGDVCGKGVAAALYAAKLGADVRYQAAGQSSPATIMQRLNRAFTQYDHEGMFVTVAIAAFRVASNRLLIANAGHPQPILCTRDGGISKAGPVGEVPLGVDDQARFSERESTLEPGDILVFYSDGITEAMNAGADLYGDERLAETIRRTRGTPQTIVDAIKSDVAAFTG
ncbi:MAG: SpoIIE family protein phosphatase, partial [Vicinamibacterales bacterium]|nr:SpoIIE family protein phosphatase [Vicinamibacterales bacterium]